MTLACIIKLETIIIDNPSLGLKHQLVSSIMTVSDAPNCSVTYDRHNDDRNSFIIQATDFTIKKFTNVVFVCAQFYNFKFGRFVTKDIEIPFICATKSRADYQTESLPKWVKLNRQGWNNLEFLSLFIPLQMLQSLS